MVYVQNLKTVVGVDPKTTIWGKKNASIFLQSNFIKPHSQFLEFK